MNAEITTIRAIEIDPVTGNFLADIPQHPENETGPHIVTTLCPPGFHKPRWDGTAWVEGKAKSDLDALIVAQKSGQIDTLRNQKIADGLSYTFPDATVGTIQIRSTIDQVNLTGLGTAALGRKNKGRTDTFAFIDGENARHALTPDQMIDMGLAVQEFVSGLTETARTKKDELAASADPINYDIEAGW